MSRTGAYIALDSTPAGSASPVALRPRIGPSGGTRGSRGGTAAMPTHPRAVQAPCERFTREWSSIRRPGGVGSIDNTSGTYARRAPAVRNRHACVRHGAAPRYFRCTGIPPDTVRSAGEVDRFAGVPWTAPLRCRTSRLERRPLSYRAPGPPRIRQADRRGPPRRSSPRFGIDTWPRPGLTTPGRR